MPPKNYIVAEHTIYCNTFIAKSITNLVEIQINSLDAKIVVRVNNQIENFDFDIFADSLKRIFEKCQ